MTSPAPTRILMAGGATRYVHATPYSRVMSLVAIARRRGEPEVRLDGRPLDVARIDKVLAPQEPHQ